MLFDMNVSAAVKCACCGKLMNIEISLFDFSNSDLSQYKCECGTIILKIKSSDCKNFCVYIPCLACEKEHLYVFNSRQVLMEKVKILSCPLSSLDITFIGNKKLVKEITEKREKDFLELMNVLEI